MKKKEAPQIKVFLNSVRLLIFLQIVPVGFKERKNENARTFVFTWQAQESSVM